MQYKCTISGISSLLFLLTEVLIAESKDLCHSKKQSITDDVIVKKFKDTTVNNFNFVWGFFSKALYVAPSTYRR